MRNFQDTLETRKRSFISDFSICMTVPLNKYLEFLQFFVLTKQDLKALFMELTKEANLRN